MRFKGAERKRLNQPTGGKFSVAIVEGTISEFESTRPLSKRGIHDAHLISSKLHDLLPKSFIIWSSNAKRAKETAMIFSQNLLISYNINSFYIMFY